MLYNHNDHMDILFLHELIVCVLVNYLYVMIYRHIDHMNIVSPHV